MMKGVRRRHKASKLASQDVISSMPDNVIANIMNRLPIRDAVRTSILARNWRLKWTLLTQLIFDCGMAKSFVIKGLEGKKYFDGRIISGLLLGLKGPVTKFALYIRTNQILDVRDLNHWVLFLSGKGIKEFTLDNYDGIPLRLPIYLFSCLELTHLELENCLFNPPPTFCGFPNLLSLVLRAVYFEGCKGGEFITQCPLLKKLTLSLRELENRAITTSGILQFLGFLPKLEELYLDFIECELVAEDGAGKWFPTMFPCLRTLSLISIDFHDGSMLSCVFGMIWGSPTLQELRIRALPYFESTGDEFYVPPAAVFSSGLESNMMGQLQLQSLEIKFFIGSKNEVFLMKYLLACSPFLKRVAVYPFICLESDEKLHAAMELLKLQRASPIAQVDFYEHGY